jgi:hypothetical protein
LLVLLDADHEGWNAYSGGRKLDILPVNGMFRAVRVEPGKDTSVTFRYEPRLGTLSRFLAWASWAAIAALLVAAATMGRRAASRTGGSAGRPRGAA